MFLRTLIAADTEDLAQRISKSLDRVGAIVRQVDSMEALQRQLASEPFDLVILDWSWAKDEAPNVIDQLRDLPEEPEVIVLRTDEDVELRAALLAAGAYAVLPRDLPDSLFGDALTALAERRLRESRTRLQPVPDEDYRLSDYVTRSPAMQVVLRSARRIAQRDTTVLLLGETGVGKGLLARSLHNEGPRSGGPFVAMNCGALTETLLEAELFGHERGAFTGADRARRGYFELAHRGTLFLDEIADMPPHLQVKLLQVLEERRVRPVGSEKEIDVDVRLIAATNRLLPDEVKAGRFREDLYYRLNVVTLTLPPLRERVEDLAELAQSYVEHFRAQMRAEARRLSSAAMTAILAHPWPGNVRELANAIERAIIMSTGEVIKVEDLPVDLQELGPRLAGRSAASSDLEADPTWAEKTWVEVRRQALEETEIRYLKGLLRVTNGRVGETAKRAGMDPRSLHEKMRKYELRKEDFRGE